MTEIDDRTLFAERQAEMTARWYRNVTSQHGDVQSYIETRWAAYLDRWNEAARFIPNGSRVLDIGGGNHFPALAQFLKSKAYNYFYRDVDPSCVISSKAIANEAGLNPENFDIGFNDKLDFPDGSFDAVFSSHCIEHSYNLSRTFRELNRVTVPGGTLTMAVPFGWEQNPEHPYFFGATEWINLVLAAGYRVRAAQIASEYPEHGFDLFISAQKMGGVSQHLLIDPENYRKTHFSYLRPDDPSIRISGIKNFTEDYVLCTGDSWSIDIDVPSSASEVLPIFARHDWSGIVEVNWGNTSTYEDLYSWYGFAHPVRVKLPSGSTSMSKSVVRIRAVGRNSASHASEGVFYGAMYR